MPYRVTKNPGVSRARRRRGLDWLAKARNPYLGWRYGIRPGENDTSVTVARDPGDGGRQVRGAAECRPATCFVGAQDVDREDDRSAVRPGWLQHSRVAVRCASRRHCRTSSRPRSSQAMTAAGILVRILRGRRPAHAARRDPEGRDGSCADLQPVWNDSGRIDMYLLVLRNQGAVPDWRRALARRGRRTCAGNVVAGQDKGGSWDPVGAVGHRRRPRLLDGDPARSTLQETLRPDAERLVGPGR